jgi:hypothetical protein
MGVDKMGVEGKRYCFTLVGKILYTKSVINSIRKDALSDPLELRI